MMVVGGRRILVGVVDGLDEIKIGPRPSWEVQTFGSYTMVQYRSTYALFYCGVSEVGEGKRRGKKEEK